MHIDDLFLRNIEELIGQDCWGVVGGEGAGSVISLSLGRRIPRNKALKNPNLTEDVRNNASQFGLMIYCPWRIESNSEVLAGSHMPNDNEGPMVKGLKHILNRKVTKVECDKPAYDLKIYYDNETRLVIHCSLIGLDEDECYSIKLTGGWFTVRFNGKVDFALSVVK